MIPHSSAPQSNKNCANRENKNIETSKKKEEKKKKNPFFISLMSWLGRVVTSEMNIDSPKSKTATTRAYKLTE